MTEKSPTKLEIVTTDFQGYFQGLGYQPISPAKITSNIDPTVLFVGSHLNNMKGYFRDENLPEVGVCSVQPAIRTQNARHFYDDVLLKFFSHFPSMGILAAEGAGKELFRQLVAYLTSILGFSLEEIKYRVNSEDTELMMLLEAETDNSQLEVNTRDANYYNHKIGEEGVNGRNFNIALKNAMSGAYDDVGNFIALDCRNGTRKRIFEVALGGSNVLRQKEGYPHVGNCYFDFKTSLLNERSERSVYKLVDSILTSLVLLSEGMKANSSKNPNRILKNYIRSILYFKHVLELSDIQLKSIIINIAMFGLPSLSQEEKEALTTKILEYTEQYLRDILRKKTLSSVEIVIKDVL